MLLLYRRHRIKTNQRRLAFIDGFQFPDNVKIKVQEKYNHLTDSDLALVEKGLKEWFYISFYAKGKAASMPSQVVDVAWHEFILFTKMYQGFCDSAFGYFLHHTPSEAMKSQKSAQKGIKLTWKIACTRENISPSTPKKLPVLFGIDARLKIPDGFKYSLNCDGPRSQGYCATHIGCTSTPSCFGGDSDSGSSGCSSCGGGGD
ncbi:hypothetical protein HR060_16680 [Catenovulum sp. SM1970]|nr:hypothetical protein [Marinifaba aquimaris]